MRAAQFSSYGPPEVLQVNEVPPPDLSDDGVLVRVRASSVNPHDTGVRSGALRIITGSKFPLGTGLDFAGEITAVGSNVHDFAVGERIWGTVPVTGKHKTGAAAEYVSVGADRIARTPHGFTDVQAAALAVVGTTAHRALSRALELKSGARLLVRGAAGGVGAAAVQLGHALGAHVTALCSSRDVDYVRSLGADKIFDYQKTTAQQVGFFDAIVDTAGTDLMSYRRHLAPNGRMVTVNFGSPKAMLAIAFSTLFGSQRIRTFSANPLRSDFEAIRPYAEAGTLRPDIGEVLPLQAVAAAHRAVETRGVRGKRVLSI